MPPQLRLHLPKEPHADTWQSLGHGPLLQYRSTLVSIAAVGHALPPKAAADTIVREHRLRLGPHVLAHVVQLCQSDSLQSTGQGTTPFSGHARVWLVTSHALPPYTACEVMPRERLATPLTPHDFEHAPHVPHGCTTQSAAHGLSLQGISFTSSSGHALPPIDA
jgi:hypothetical protein